MIFFIKKSFNDFQNQNFKSEIIFHWTGRKILKYFSDIYNHYLSILLQKWAQASKVK